MIFSGSNNLISEIKFNDKLVEVYLNKNNITGKIVPSLSISIMDISNNNIMDISNIKYLENLKKILVSNCNFLNLDVSKN
jgi:Leucine-rich repeat (LRR) protein